MTDATGPASDPTAPCQRCGVQLTDAEAEGHACPVAERVILHDSDHPADEPIPRPTFDDRGPQLAALIIQPAAHTLTEMVGLLTSGDPRQAVIVLSRIEQVSERLRGVITALTPGSHPPKRRRKGPWAALGENPEDYGMSEGYGGLGGTDSETFGAQALTQMTAMLKDILPKKAAGSGARIDHLIAAQAKAKDAGLEDEAAAIGRRVRIELGLDDEAGTPGATCAACHIVYPEAAGEDGKCPRCKPGGTWATTIESLAEQGEVNVRAANACREAGVLTIGDWLTRRTATSLHLFSMGSGDYPFRSGPVRRNLDAAAVTCGACPATHLDPPQEDSP